MADFTIKRVEEMEAIFDGIVHRARASARGTGRERVGIGRPTTRYFEPRLPGMS